MDMSNRIALSRRCILLKKVPNDVDEQCIGQCISRVENCQRHSEFNLEQSETGWIVLLTSIEGIRYTRFIKVWFQKLFGTKRPCVKEIFFLSINTMV